MYVLAKYKEHQKDVLFRNYIANSLQLIPQGKHIVKTYNDLLTPHEEKTGEEIVIDIITRHNLKVRTDE